MVALNGSSLLVRCRCSGCVCRGSQILGDGSATDVQVTRDLTHRPVLGKMEAMDSVDLLAAQHGLPATYNAAGAVPP